MADPSFTGEYVSEKVKSWAASLLTLSNIGKAHPHMAYCAYVHGLANKWTYFLRTIPNISDLLQPLEDVIFHHFIPALIVSDLERALFALPVRLGGLGICDPRALADTEFAASVNHWLIVLLINRVFLTLILLLASIKLRPRLFRRNMNISPLRHLGLNLPCPLSCNVFYSTLLRLVPLPG